MNRKIIILSLAGIFFLGSFAHAEDEFHWPLFFSAIRGGSGTEEINGTNPSEVSGAVVHGLQKVIASDLSSSFVPTSGGSYAAMTKASQDFQICTTGTASMNIDDSGTFGSVNYSDCTIGYGDYGVTVDGSLTFSFTPSNATFSFNSVTVTSNSGMSASISGDLSCTYSAGAADCNFSFETSYGGVTYSVTHTSISGDPSSGYTVNYEMSSAAYGTIFVATTNPVTFNCSNGYPDSGSVTFTGANGFSGSIAFNSCTSYTVTVDGVSTPYTW